MSTEARVRRRWTKEEDELLRREAKTQRMGPFTFSLIPVHLLADTPSHARIPQGLEPYSGKARGKDQQRLPQKMAQSAQKSEKGTLG